MFSTLPTFVLNSNYGVVCLKSRWETHVQSRTQWELEFGVEALFTSNNPSLGHGMLQKPTNIFATLP